MVAGTDADSHFGYGTLDGFPIAEIAGFSLTKASDDADLSAPVGQAIEPSDKLLSLAQREHQRIVAKRIQKSSKVGVRALTPQFSGCALPYVPWRSIHHGPLQLLIRPSPADEARIVHLHAKPQSLLR